MTTTTSYESLERAQLLAMLASKDSLLEKEKEEVARLRSVNAHILKTYEQLLLAYERLKHSLLGRKQSD